MRGSHLRLAVLLACAGCTAGVARQDGDDPSRRSGNAPVLCSISEPDSTAGTDPWTFPDTLAFGGSEDVTVHSRDVPAGFAAGTTWFRRLEPIRFMGVDYAPISRPKRMRPVSSSDPGATVFLRVGTFDGVPLYAAADQPEPPRWIALPLAPSCVMHLYSDLRELN